MSTVPPAKTTAPPEVAIALATASLDSIPPSKSAR